MDLTPKGFKKSEVTENKELVKVGTFLTYSDVCNYQEFEVIEVAGSLATVKALNPIGRGYKQVIDLDALQLGWKFAMTDQQTKLYAAISPGFGPRFAFNAKSADEAQSLINGYNRYHSYHGDLRTAYTALEIDSLDGLTIGLHNEYVN